MSKRGTDYGDKSLALKPFEDVLIPLAPENSASENRVK